MTRIFIDTDELREIATDLRNTTGEVGDLLGRLGTGFASIWMPVGPHFKVREGAQDAQLRVLALRIHNDANSLVIEATRREAEDSIREIAADAMGGVRWALHELDEAWDWTSNSVGGSLARLGQGAWKVGKTAVKVLAVVVIITASKIPVVDWLVRKVRRNTRYRTEVAEPLDPDLRLPGPPPKTWEAWITELQGTSFSYAEYMKVIGVMPLGTVVVIKVGEPPARWAVLARGIALKGSGRSFNSLDTAALSVHLDWGPYEAAIEAAMVKAGVQKGDHLMLVGHSQGGISTRNLAADRRFTHDYQVDGVLTGGSPVQNGFPPVDARTHTVALNNLWDPVPKLSLDAGAYDGLAQRGSEVDYVFNRTGSRFDPHSTDHYVAELDGLSSSGTGITAADELRRPPFSQYVGGRPVPGGVHVVSALASTSN